MFADATTRAGRFEKVPDCGIALNCRHTYVRYEIHGVKQVGLMIGLNFPDDIGLGGCMQKKRANLICLDFNIGSVGVVRLFCFYALWVCADYRSLEYI